MAEKDSHPTEKLGVVLAIVVVIWFGSAIFTLTIPQFIVSVYVGGAAVALGAPQFVGYTVTAVVYLIHVAVAAVLLEI